MAGAGIKEQLKILAQLQEVDSRVYKLKRRLEGIPVEIEKKTGEFESQKTGLNALQERNKALLVNKKDKELELAVKEETMKKLQGQLFQIKTNKEYAAMLKEIEGAKADKSLMEDDILKIMMDSDNLKVEVEKEKASLAVEEKKLNEERAKLKEEEGIVSEEISTFNNKREQIALQVDAKTLNVYERILKNRDGLALVKVVDNACQGCFMNVPHQVVNEIRMYERLVNCGMCARILYEEGS